MPIYDYECEGCGAEFTEMLKIADRKAPCERPCDLCGGEIKQLLNAPMIVDPVRAGIIKPSSEFNDVLTKIHEKTPGSKLGEKLQGSRPENTGASTAKSQEAARKFIKKAAKDRE